MRLLKKIFISYKYEDNAEKNGIEGALRNPNNSIDALSVSERNDLRSQGENAVKNYLRERIRKSDVVVCLIGQDTHNSQMVQWELEVATSLGKRIVPVQIRGTSGGPPKLIRDRNISIIGWNDFPNYI